VWSGELVVEQKLNTEVTTAFPVGEVLKDLVPGVYAMTATPTGTISDDYGQLATQWFIVSDLGLTAYSGQDGIDVFVHSLASAEARGYVSVRLLARNNEVLATKPTDRNGLCISMQGFRAARAGSSPAAIVVTDKTDYAFLSLKSPAFDLSDRGVSGRQVPAGLDAFVYTERGVYRRGESVYVTALLARCARIVSASVRSRWWSSAGRRRISPRRGRRPGPRRPQPDRADRIDGGRAAPGASAPFTDPKGAAVARPPSWSRTMSPTASNSISPRPRPSCRATARRSVEALTEIPLRAPASNLDLTGQVTIAAAKERPASCYAFG